MVGILLYVDSDLATAYLSTMQNSTPALAGSKIPIPYICHISLQEEVLEANKLQRHYEQHCETTTKVSAGGTGVNSGIRLQN